MKNIKTGNFICLTYIIFASVILTIKNGPAITNPIAGHEDGRDLLALFFNDSSWLLLFRYYAGYVSIGPNLLARIASFAPILWVPHLFVGLSLLVATGTMTAVIYDRSRLFAGTRVDRLVVAVILIALPLGKSYMFTNVTYSQWHMLFILLMLLIQPVPGTRLKLFGWCMLTVIVTFSNPLSIFGLPLLIAQWREVRTAAQRVTVALCGLTMAAYQLYGIQHHPVPAISPASCIFAIRVYLSRVIVESVAGPRLTTALEAHGFGWLTAVTGVGLLLAWFGCRQHLRRRFPGAFSRYSGNGSDETHRHRQLLIWIELYLWVVAFAIVFTSVHLRYTEMENPAIRSIFLVEPNLQRYVYIPKMIIMYMVLSRVIPILRAWLENVSIPMKIVSGLVFSIYLMIVNVHNISLWRTDPSEGRRLKAFLEEVDLNTRRKASGREYEPRMILERDGDWDIIFKFDTREVNGQTQYGYEE